MIGSGGAGATAQDELTVVQGLHTGTGQASALHVPLRVWLICPTCPVGHVSVWVCICGAQD
jgi:hypothetical protein